MIENSRKIIFDLKQGNHRVYEMLMDTYYQKLCVYALNLCLDRNAAEDIVQNVFFKLWKNRKALKDEFNITSTLYRSVYNEFVDQYRKKQAVSLLEKKYIEALDTIVEEVDDVSFNSLLALVKSEIERLPKKYKNTFLLSKQEGLTNMEIAEYLGLSIKTVESHITKSYAIIRKNVDAGFFSFVLLFTGARLDENKI
ncbi:MAG: RNA polymerase sigma factor [Flavobacteriaceae bacterium]